MRALAWFSSSLVVSSIALACGGGSSSTTGPGGPGGAPPPTAKPDPAPVVDGDVTEAWVSGMHILVKHVPGAETTATHLYIQGGVRNWSKADAGIEALALRTATTGGVQGMSKDDFTRRLTEIGSSITAEAGDDYSSIEAWSLTGSWDDTFAMLADVFRRPALPATQLELVRAQQLSRLRHEQEDPDSRLGLLVHTGVWHGHPYENRVVGTLESVASIKPDQLEAHLAKLRQTSRLLLVVVGGVDASRVVAAARQGFGDLPRGEYRDEPLAAWKSGAAAVQIVEQKMPTNYIQAVFPGPAVRDPDYFAALVAMTTLGQREFEEVRTKRNLSYAPGAWLDNSRPQSVGTLYVTAVDPVTTMKVMLDQARRLREEPVGETELDGTKSMLLTRMITALQTPAGQAAGMARFQLMAGDWRLLRAMPDRVRAVTADQVKTWAAANMTKLRTFVIGDKSKIDRATLESF